MLLIFLGASPHFCGGASFRRSEKVTQVAALSRRPANFPRQHVAAAKSLKNAGFAGSFRMASAYRPTKNFYDAPHKSSVRRKIRGFA
ncbi:hypothetical protein [Methylocystis parvus]|uniref:Uncharacterized protein n=1 Tax=Methylocystis parvus TaxID=134 RepID=A0A6B8MC07_9HYPH|nr:hypothetical protein [Methylocystis parvus]QGM98873.1 hypothetical protein F7D14_16215 [Methylocystis parvus]WBK00774.1 hypothetical protein MMG94_03330 [Methylocystis parvus OBBP]